jgi:DNA repair exonuclease SbcCD ATPase subunit
MWVSAQNFASYENVDFNFADQGLTLIQGSTGAGKSTLCDLVPWTLFGRTAKDGGVDEVISWPDGKIAKIAKSAILIDLGENTLLVSRTRGNKSNDLWFSKENSEPQRGKDLNDTQVLINDILGIDLHLYLSGSYFHEFSQIAQFFTATPKNRRIICEQLADLKFVNHLQELNIEKIKESEKRLTILKEAILKLKHNVEVLKKVQLHETTKKQNWEKDKEQKLSILEQKKENHTLTKNVLLEKLFKDMEYDIQKQLTATKCSECGAEKIPNPLIKPVSRFQTLIDVELEKVNPYILQIQELNNQKNPHSDSVTDYTFEIKDKTKLFTQLEKQENELMSEINDLKFLKDIFVEFRSVVIKNVILRAEENTNYFISNYFDSEIRISLDVTQTDKLEIEIKKDGNSCAYTQLSKGQRQILKLCFAVSIMKEISNHHGVNFNVLFFDEALSGLDDVMKVKAFRMFEFLSSKHESVFVIDHNEAFKTMFLNKYNVSLQNGKSVIEKETM